LHRDFRYVTDVLPSLLDLVGIPLGDSAIDGVSFAGDLRGDNGPAIGGSW
jgi:hypothetical protein